MGNGTAVVKNYKLKQPYYCAKDFDARFGGDFWFLIEPLRGWSDEERFFYVREMADGKFELTGEGYIVSGKRPVERLKELREKLKNIKIQYVFLDENGSEVRRE